MNRSTQALIITVGLAITGTTPGAGPSPQAGQDALAAKISPLFAEWDRPDSPGAAIAVIKNGKIIYKRGYGSAQLEYEIPITPSTVFHVASVSKQFTAMAVAMLADRGELSLDDDIRKYLPDVPDFGKRITIRQLLHHTSGIRDQWELLGMAGWRLDDVITKEQILTMMRHQQELNFEPNTEHLYTNMGYTLAAEIVAKVSGQSFPDFTKQRIFERLGMTDTHFHDDHEMIVKNRAYSYAATDDGYRKAVLSYANAGATSLFTTAEDLTKWLDNFRHAGVGGRAVIDQMQERGVLNDGKRIDYALGLAIGEYKGLKTVSHGGGDAGFRSYVVWFPDQKVGIAVLSNLASFNPRRTALQVADAVLAEVLPPDEPSAEEAKPAERTAVAVDPSVYDRYVGIYELSIGFILSVTKQNNRLMGQVAELPAFEFVPQSKTEFFLRVFDAQLTFHPDETGEADSLTIMLGGQPVSGTRIETPTLSRDELAEYTGVYYSDELGTFYTLEVEDDRLVARHRRHGTIALTPTTADEFIGSQWFLEQVRFTRDAAAQVTGLRVTTRRVRNLRFDRLRQ